MKMPDSIRVGLLSFLTLFTELALIRYLPAHFLYLGFFANIILVASFLGIGVGFLLGKRPCSLVNFFPIALGATVILASISQATIQVTTPDIIFFADEFYPSKSPISPLVILPIIFAFVAIVFTTLSHALAKLFAQSQHPLRTYTWDLVGSIAGLTGFSIVSFFATPPIIWFGIIAGLFLTVIPLPKLYRLITIIAFSLAIVASIDRGPGDVFWSPYYKLTLMKNEKEGFGYLFANNIGHQSYARLQEALRYPLIFAQLFRGRQPKDVLIIGSGMGQDVAAALAAGAGHVDAVDIDPTILAIGKRFHPERPYQDPRVTVINNDGRAMLANSTKRYDLIIFALTDSLALTSGLGDIRLESYLFTRESFQLARQHLTPTGSFVLYNDYRAAWLIERIGTMLTEAFGTPPLVMYLGPTTRMFLTSPTPRPADPTSLLKPFTPSATHLTTPTDDWPFLYLSKRSIPSIYLSILATLVAVSTIAVVAVLLLGKQSLSRTKLFAFRLLTFFFLGAAFSLIETKSLAQLALLFGITWLVNSLAFGGILLTVLLATLVATRFRLPKAWVLPILLASLTLQYIVPVHLLLLADPLVRIALSLPYFFLPIFIANVFFADLFKDTTTPELDMGSNILGLVVGGITEYAALVTGYSALALVALGFYGLAWYCAHRAKLS